MYTTNQDAIRRLFGVFRDSAGNLASMPGRGRLQRRLIGSRQFTQYRRRKTKL
jgi:hypothetical protein